MEFRAKPATCPRSPIDAAPLKVPPKVPRFVILPSRHNTARPSGAFRLGSNLPFVDVPATSPRSLIPKAVLQLLSEGHNAPRSISLPRCHLNAWLAVGPGKQTNP